MSIELFPMRKTRKEVTHILISHYAESPSPALPKGRELNPAEFKDVEALLLPLGEGWDGASMLGWGLHGGWYAPLATLKELRFHSPGLRCAAPLPWVYV